MDSYTSHSYGVTVWHSVWTVSLAQIPFALFFYCFPKFHLDSIRVASEFHSDSILLELCVPCYATQFDLWTQQPIKNCDDLSKNRFSYLTKERKRMKSFNSKSNHCCLCLAADEDSCTSSGILADDVCKEQHEALMYSPNKPSGHGWFSFVNKNICLTVQSALFHAITVKDMVCQAPKSNGHISSLHNLLFNPWTQVFRLTLKGVVHPKMSYSHDAPNP